MISFARGAPSLDIVDVEGLKDAAAAALTEDPAGTTAYGTSIGYVPLRRWIAEQHGVDEARVLVTNGSMQADAFLFDALVSKGDAVIVEKPTYDRTLLGLKHRGADIRMVSLEHDGISVDELRDLLRSGRAPDARPHHPQLPEPGRLHAQPREARRAARAGPRVRLHDLRGRPVHRDPVHGPSAADDAVARRPGGRERRLRLVVLQDGLPRDPRRLPDRPPGPDRAHRPGGDQHVHLAEHGRPVDRVPVLLLRARSTTRSRPSARRSPIAWRR